MLDTPSLLESLEIDNTQRRVASRRALALAHNRVERNLGRFLRAAQTEEEFFERLALVQEDFNGYVTTASLEVEHDHPEHIATALKDHYRLADKVRFTETPAEEQEKEDEETAPVVASSKQAWNVVSIMPTPGVGGGLDPNMNPYMQGSPTDPNAGVPPQPNIDMLQGQQPPVQDPNAGGAMGEMAGQMQHVPGTNPTPQQQLMQQPQNQTFMGSWRIVSEDEQSPPLAKEAEGLFPDDYTEDDFAGDEVAPCPHCGGQAFLMGQLGHTNHYRCRNCGANTSQPSTAPEDQAGLHHQDDMAPFRPQASSNEHDLVTCPECGGDGKTAGATKCPKCAGKGRVVNFGDSMVDNVGADIKTAGEGNTDLGGPEPKMDKSQQTDTNPGKPDYEDGPRHPTKEKDPLKAIGPPRDDHELEEIHGQDGFHKNVDLPTQKGPGPFADNNMEQGQHTKTFGDKGQTDPVTKETISSADDVYKGNPLVDILTSDFPSDAAVHQALLRLYK